MSAHNDDLSTQDRGDSSHGLLLPAQPPPYQVPQLQLAAAEYEHPDSHEVTPAV